MQELEIREKYSDNHYRMLADIAEQGKQRAQERERLRQRRELESEIHGDDLRRIWATLDEQEQQVLKRLMDQEPPALEKIQKFKAERYNPIADIDDRRTLYRMATEQVAPPQRERWIEPIENIENVDDPHTLYEMANKQMQEKKEVRK